MKKFLIPLLALSMAVSGTSVFAAETTKVTKEEETGDKKIITYLPCWESKPWDVEDIQGDKLTHAYLSFARIDNGFKISDKEVRIHTEGGQYAMPDLVSATMIVDETWGKVEELQKKYPDMKFIIAVGGWEAEGFSDMVANAANREIFVDSVVDYVNKHNLDGVDLDWEYPVNGSWGVIKSRPEDKQNFTELIKLLRQKLGPDKEISFCANVSGWFLDVIDFEAVVPLVDSVNIMSYDMHGTWDDKAFHHAPLYPNPDDPVVSWGLSVSETVDRFIGANIPAEKLVIGIPTYGREFRNVEAGPNNDGLFQPFITDAEGNMTADKSTWRGGQIPYSVLKGYFIDKNGFTSYWDDDSMNPYLFDGQTFITYDNEKSVEAKCKYALEKDLAGVMYWEYVNDIDGELLTVMSNTLNK